jgi:hypothetical protein
VNVGFSQMFQLMRGGIDEDQSPHEASPQVSPELGADHVDDLTLIKLHCHL